MNNNDWTSLSSGTLERIASNMPADRQQRKYRTYAAGVVLAVLFAATSIGLSLRGGNGDSSPMNKPMPSVAKMNCVEATSLFASYHDGSLADAKKHLLADHLDYCESCQLAYTEQFGVAASAVGHPFASAMLAVTGL